MVINWKNMEVLNMGMKRLVTVISFMMIFLTLGCEKNQVIEEEFTTLSIGLIASCRYGTYFNGRERRIF